MMTSKLLAACLFALLLSCGDSPSGPSEELSVTVTAPPAEGAEASESYTVEWVGKGQGTVALYYNTTQSPVGQQLIATDLPSSGNHPWDLSTVASGEYFVRAVITRGTETASGWSQGTLAVDHSQGEPGIVVTAPPPEGAQADESYTLMWVSSGFNEGTVTLWYDTDTNPEHGLVEVAGGLEDTGQYLWDCSEVPEGFYYIRAEITDGEKTENAYSQGRLFITRGPDPWISVEKPPAEGDNADNYYTIEWISEAPAGATVTLWYDTDTNPDQGLVPIASGLYNDGYFTWDCSGVPEGSYYIYAQLMAPPGRRGALAGLRAMTGRQVLASAYSQGMLTISHDIPWTITVTAPPAEGAQADESYLVEWESDAPPSETLDIFYAADTTGAPLYPVASGVPNSGSHLWDTTMVPEGSWYVYAAFTTRSLGSAWSSGTVTIVHEDMYSFSFTAPPPEGATADQSYMIQWETDAPYGASWVYLFYSTTNQPGGYMYTIVEGTPNTGMYNWDCGSVPEGVYWIYGFVTDERMRRPVASRGTGSAWSEGTLTIDHSGYSMTVTAPPPEGAVADSSYTIEWVATGGSGSVIALYYDDDTNPNNGMTLIADGLSNTGSYLWDTTLVPEGDWYVYAAIYDPDKGPPAPGTDAFAGAYSQGVLTIQHEFNYIILITPPSWGATADEEYQIIWAAETPYGGTVSLYYDDDTNPDNGMEFIVSGLPWDSFGYLWDCSAVPEGQYYLYAKLENAHQTLTSYSQGILTIQRNPLLLVFDAPPPEGATADETYTLAWFSLGAQERTIDLYYDDDTNPDNGMTLIAEGVPSSQYYSTFEWNCSSVPEGSYFIYGLLHGAGWTYEKYSEGMLTIVHN